MEGGWLFSSRTLLIVTLLREAPHQYDNMGEMFLWDSFESSIVAAHLEEVSYCTEATARGP